MGAPARMRWLVTAGPTCEDIDPVRFISNRSSGAMGYAIAEAARARGDAVDLVTGPVALDPPAGCDVVRVRSAREMYDAVLARLGAADVVVMAAAVSDFRPRSFSAEKIRRTAAGLVLELEPCEDILAEVGRRRSRQVLIGFALETPGAGEPTDAITDAMRRSAERKLREKLLDAIVLNGPGAIGSPLSEIAVLRKDSGWEAPRSASKRAHASRIVDLAAALASARRPPAAGRSG